jgi:hypothetical protein|uniref:Uncharacterized protein n=1 Tax=viral metagenome TaxID=1070528 RepID=A0A6C0DLE9_9ZZZZ
MSNFIDNIPNKKTNDFTPITDFDNFRDINKLIEGFAIIDNEDLEHSSYNTRPSYKNEKKNRHVEFLPSSLNDKIDAIIKKEINADKPEQYVVLAKNDNETDKFLLDNHINHVENTYTKQNDSIDNSSKNNKKKMDVVTNVYIGSLTIVALFLVYRFIQKSK